jgi:dipeptidyl aminopeptidase/acylaminoacyl peptidase
VSETQVRMRTPVTTMVLAVALAALATTAVAQQAATYRTPPPAIAELLTAPRLPRGAPSLSPDGTRMLLPDLRGLIPIATLAEPVEKLAGLEILPGLRASRSALKAAASGLSVVTLADGASIRAALPEGSRLAGMAWSTRGDRVAVATFAEGGCELWIVDAATGAARRLEGVRVQGVPRVSLEWTLDDRRILTALIPAQPALAPASRVPAGPQVRVGTGRAAGQRTARDVLRTAEDQGRFSWYTRSQLAFVPVDGGPPQPLGEPASYLGCALAPDETHLLVVRLPGAPPLGFPFMLYPRAYEVWGADGRRVAVVGEQPLNERSAISSVAPLGPREVTFSPDGRALWFCSWQDTPGADAMAAVRDTTKPQPGADRLMRLDAPFTGEPVVVASTDMQVGGLSWSVDGARLVVYEGYSPRRVERAWWLDPAKPARHVLLVSRSTEGVYDDPGSPQTRDAKHLEVLWTTPDGKAFWCIGDGFRPGGQRPFLDRVTFEGGRATRVFESADPAWLETPVALLAGDGSRFLTTRQSHRVPPDLVLRADRGRRWTPVTHFPDPAAALAAAQRISFAFTRADSVTLNAEALLPADWTPGHPLPTVFWIYPNDYRSAAAASQDRTSPNRYPSQSTLNPEVLVTQGYAVVRPDLAVVGTNDRYVEEVRASAAAAIAECARRGYTDPKRVGVGGHSYGAFSTVNLLAHTDLFRAGWASDGAYNRTLTPFTFQAEERTLWQAPETYLRMSPFMYADSVRAPLLLMHNLDDTNVGTNPIQSERMFEALNGMGRQVTLVQYPYEDHSPASRETVLDYWARVLEWMDRYVKEPAATPGGAPGSTP